MTVEEELTKLGFHLITIYWTKKFNYKDTLNEDYSLYYSPTGKTLSFDEEEYETSVDEQIKTLESWVKKFKAHHIPVEIIRGARGRHRWSKDIRENRDTKGIDDLINYGYKKCVNRSSCYFIHIKKEEYDKDGDFTGEDYRIFANVGRFSDAIQLNFSETEYEYEYSDKVDALVKEQRRLKDLGFWSVSIKYPKREYTQEERDKRKSERERRNEYREEKHGGRSGYGSGKSDYRGWDDFFNRFYRNYYNRGSYDSGKTSGFKTQTEWWKELDFTAIPSDFATVKKRYRELARKYHPDIAGQSGEEKMKKINDAYEKAEKYFGVN